MELLIYLTADDGDEGLVDEFGDWHPGTTVEFCDWEDLPRIIRLHEASYGDKVVSIFAGPVPTDPAKWPTNLSDSLER